MKKSVSIGKKSLNLGVKSIDIKKYAYLNLKKKSLSLENIFSLILLEFQCDQIVAETPNRDVWGVQMSLIFRKCRLAFFVTFKPKMAFFLSFLIFGRLYPIFASFLKKVVLFPTKFSLRGITFYISTSIWYFAQVFLVVFP